MRRAFNVWLTLLVLLLAPSAWAAEIAKHNVSGPSLAPVTTFRILPTHAVDDYGAPVETCMGGMRFHWDQGDGADITVYPADPEDDTAAELEANTALVTFSAGDDTSGVLKTDHRFVRFVVDAVDTSVHSSLRIECSGLATGSSATSPFDQCRSGTTKGGGYDSNTQRYEWTCGNYNWTAEKGGVDANGVSSYDTPTTAGGNSWYMDCTSDGFGTAEDGGSPNTYEQGACLDGTERIKMYAGPDLAIALDQVKQGGPVYLPRGIYHDAYCGQSSSQVANGCPVTRDHPYVAQKKFTSYGGRYVVGEGADKTGIQDGRQGTVWLSDHGNDINQSGGIADGYPPVTAGTWVNITGGATFAGTNTGGHWGLSVGAKGSEQYCAWPSNSTTGCVTTTSTVTNVRDRIEVTPIGQVVDVVRASYEYLGSQPVVCVDNRLSVCSGNTRVKCTVNDETRTGDTTGGCPGALGDCIGVADAVEDLLQAGEKVYLGHQARPVATYGTSNEVTGTSEYAFTELGSMHGSTCDGGNGRYVRNQDPDDPIVGGSVYDFMTRQDFNLATSPSVNNAHVLTQDEFNNFGSGFRHMTIMPAQWAGRDSPNLDAECGADELATSLESDGSGCDQVELMSLSQGYGGRVEDLALYFGGGGTAASTLAFSGIDGAVACMNCGIKDSFIANGRGLGTDASGWWFENNVWSGWLTGSDSLVKAAFAYGFKMESDQFIQNAGDSLFNFQGAPGGVLRDIQLVGNDVGTSLFRTSAARDILVSGVTGYGNFGGIVWFEGSVEGGNDVNAWNVIFEDIFLENHNFPSGSNFPQALISRVDYSGDAPWKGLGIVRNMGVSVSLQYGHDGCLIFFDGLTGDDSTADHGLNVDVDDDRDHFVFENIDVQVYDPDTPGIGKSFCFGNSANTAQNDPSDAAVLTNWSTIKGPVPYWKNLRFDDVKVADNLTGSISAADAGDCGVDVVPGTVHLIHDLDTPTLCSETAGILDSDANDATNTRAACKCQSGGTWALF